MRPPTESLPVSVVIPAYNREAMVARAVASALGQRPLPPAEVIVVDDCSTDATAEAAAAAGARIVRHERNRGEGAARNTGIAHARQPWVALLDSDDEWMADLLATLWPLRDGHVVVGGASLNCGPDPDRDRYAGPLGRRPQVVRSPAGLIYPENFVAASGTMVRRDVVEAVGGYATELKDGTDMDLWIRVLERGSGIFVPRPVAVYHLHPAQVTSDTEMMVAAHRAVACAYAGRPWWSARTLARWEGAAAYDAARRAWAAGERGRALARLAGLLVRPPRAAGAVGVAVRRARLGRRSGLVDRAGVPTVALLPGVRGGADGALDLRAATSARAMARLARRPTRRVVAATPAQALAARLIGVSEVTRSAGGA